MKGDRRADGLGVVLALVGSAWFAHGSPAFSLDDAYIHLAYAKSLWLGDGLSYNPGDWELGATSPLWALCLAPLSTLASVQTAVQVLTALLHAAGSYATARLAHTLGAARWPSAGAGVMFALHPLLLQASTSGMEVSLAALLLVTLTIATLRERHLLASVLGFAAVLARPEALVFACLLALGRAWQSKQPQPLWVAVGPALAMACWCGYCTAVAGYPLPNTFYAKAGFEPWLALRFLVERLLAEEPWAIAAVWLLFAPTRRVEAGVYALTVLAIALGRSLHPDLLFTQQRYFACFEFMPAAVLAASLPSHRPRLAGLLAASVLFLSAFSAPRALSRTRAQERNTRVLHVDVATFVNESLPQDTRIAVEGAGALRFYTARSLTVIDVLGLNDRRIMHAGTSTQHLCASATRLPAFLIVPDALIPAFSALYDGELLQRFHSEGFAHVIEPYPWTVHVVRVRGLHPAMVEKCR
jgi:hypothetical protein